MWRVMRGAQWDMGCPEGCGVSCRMWGALWDVGCPLGCRVGCRVPCGTRGILWDMGYPAGYGVQCGIIEWLGLEGTSKVI